MNDWLLGALDALGAKAVQALSVLISFFPPLNFYVQADIQNFINSLNGAFAMADVFVPVNILVMVLSVMLSVELSIFAFKLYRWLASNVTLGILK